LKFPVTAIGFAVTGAARPMVVTTRVAAARVFIIFDLLLRSSFLTVAREQHDRSDFGVLLRPVQKCAFCGWNFRSLFSCVICAKLWG
jgi:hypothetical protein